MNNSKIQVNKGYPYVSGPHVAENHQFLGREKMLNEIIQGSNNFWVIGSRRIGKTSLLKRIEYLIEEDKSFKTSRQIIPLFIDVIAAPQSLEDQLHHFRTELLKAIEDVTFIQLPDFSHIDNFFGILDELTKYAQNNNKEILLLFDEAEAFAQIKDLSTIKMLRKYFSKKHQRVVMASTLYLRLLHEVEAESPLSSFLGIFTVLHLSVFDNHLAIKLINKGLSSLSEANKNQIIEVTNGHPWLIQYICRELFSCDDLFRNHNRFNDFFKRLTNNNQIKEILKMDIENLPQDYKNILYFIQSQKDVGLEDIKTKYLSIEKLYELEALGYIKADKRGYNISNIFLQNILEGILMSVGQWTPINNENIELIFKGDNEMILETLTTATIVAGTKFLFDQLEKVIDRLNDRQLAQIENKKSQITKLVETSQSIENIKSSVKQLLEVLPKDIQIDSSINFKSWITDKITEDYAELEGVGKLLHDILIKKRNKEPNSEKKNVLLEMTTNLIADIKELKEIKRIGNEDRVTKIKLHKRIVLALDLL